MRENILRIIKISAIFVLFIILLIYAFFSSRNLIFGVKIKNVNLEDSAKIVENTINISGVAKNAVFLTLNDREISIDKKGNFNETIALLSGYNIIEIKARDKFGHHNEKVYRLMH